MANPIITVIFTYADGLERTVVGTFGQLRHAISVRHPKKPDRPVEIHFVFPASLSELERAELKDFYNFRMSPDSAASPTHEVTYD